MKSVNNLFSTGKRNPILMSCAQLNMQQAISVVMTAVKSIPQVATDFKIPKEKLIEALDKRFSYDHRINRNYTDEELSDALRLVNLGIITCSEAISEYHVTGKVMNQYLNCKIRRNFLKEKLLLQREKSHGSVLGTNSFSTSSNMNESSMKQRTKTYLETYKNKDGINLLDKDDLCGLVTDDEDDDNLIVEIDVAQDDLLPILKNPMHKFPVLIDDIPDESPIDDKLSQIVANDIAQDDLLPILKNPMQKFPVLIDDDIPDEPPIDDELLQQLIKGGSLVDI